MHDSNTLQITGSVSFINNSLTDIAEAQITGKYSSSYANKLYRPHNEFETSNYKTESIINIL